MLDNSLWIAPKIDMGDIAPEYKKTFLCKKEVESAKLYITAMGVYVAVLNGKRVGNFILAPGWTNYAKRHQVQCYDITEIIEQNNTLSVLVGKGWCRGVMPLRDYNVWSDTSAIIASIEIKYTDGETESITTDESWEVYKSEVLYSDIYNGEYCDARGIELPPRETVVKDFSKKTLIMQEGEIVTEHERIKPKSYFVSPRGEHIIDFGQNLTGYVEFTVDANYGEKITISHAETLDSNGNFYTANLRVAKAKIDYICKQGVQTYKPRLTFMGFRYIRLDDFPTEINTDDFTAIVVHSDLKRTGYFECSNELVNKLYENVIWGQKDNYLDIPTDCPQRDERLGWTGDAQIFVKTASYNYDVEKFFKKWLADLASEQYENGSVPNVIPYAMRHTIGPDEDGWCNVAAWGDAAVICPWQIYLTYGNADILENQIESMEKWVNFIRNTGDNEYLWNTGKQLGDWLATDAEDGSWKGATNPYFLATAFYANSVKILIKALKVLNRDAAEYEKLYDGIIKAFRSEYKECKTQTECAVSLVFGLAKDKKQTAKKLVELIEKNGNKLSTGFVGTPYLLYALSENGYAKEAYSLLLQTECPSWLFSVKMGATTMWEHWDSKNEKGEFWSTEMNSFNHYAYGAVASWMYEVMAGIKTDENAPGFNNIIIEPVTDMRFSYVQASIDTRAGMVKSRWERIGEQIKYSITVPASALFIANGEQRRLEKGYYEIII